MEHPTRVARAARPMKQAGLLALMACLPGCVAAQDAPQFVEAYFSGPLDSIYNAESARLEGVCRGQPAACFGTELDTTAVALADVFAAPGAAEPAGRLAARLRPRGRYPYAGLVFLATDGRQVPLFDDVGDWGYGMTLDLAEARDDGWIRPWLLAPAGPFWLRGSGDVGFGVVEGPYGLEGRLWQLGPVQAGGATLPEGVYMILAVEAGVVRLRAEAPQDMPCGDDPPAGAPTPPVHRVPLAALLDGAGRAVVRTAYSRGC